MADLIAVRVMSKRRETADICALQLVAADGGDLPAYTAGAHVDVHLPEGMIRQYSLLGPPAETACYEIAVLRETASRGGSQAIHDTIAEGQPLTISAPRNLFPLAEAADPAVLFAGGIGITPLLCMAQVLHARKTPFDLHYCARSRDRAAFLDRLAAAPFAGQVHLHFDDGPPDQRLDMARTLAAAPAGAHVYICGPGGFIAAVQAAAATWDPDHVHVEYFKAEALDTTGDAPFEIEIASSGETFLVPAGRSALDVLTEAGFDIPSSCEEGICGSCITPVRAGEIVHRDQILTDAERQSNALFTPCCSRGRGRLVVDL